MKTSHELKLSTQTDRDYQLYHKNTFGTGTQLGPPPSVRSISSVSFANSTVSPVHQNTQRDSLITFNVPFVQKNRQLYPVSNSNLSTGISSLTYGLSCLIYEAEKSQIFQCLVMVHEEYINILHLIINRGVSYLLKLNNVKSIDFQDTFIAGKLALVAPEFRQSFIVFNLKSLDTIVLLFRTQNERDIIYKGLKFFFVEGREFYEKLSQFDPFRAESMMLFLEADKDGGNLLDIDEILSILGELKINKEKLDIESDVLQINKSLYERENIKRPKNASSSELTPLAFEYLLRYYSTKEQLTKFFKEYCPMFKPKAKNHKNTIIDCIKNNQKPIMSSVQLKVFYQEILNEIKGEEELNEIIRKFPLYDGQGREKFQFTHEEPLLNFDNFCNLVCSALNSLYDPNDTWFGLNKEHSEQNEMSIKNSEAKQQKSYFSHSMLDYYIYSDLSMKNLKKKQKSNFYNLALKRGVKCITLLLTVSLVHHSKGTTQNNKNKNELSKLGAIVVRIDQNQKQQLFVQDILNDVKTFAFGRNKLPFWIVFDFHPLLKHPNYVQYLELLADIIDQCLEKENIFINNSPKQDKKNILPSPLQLQAKFILLTNFNAKIVQKISGNKNQSYEIPKNLSKKFSFSAVKLDFQRKGQNCWNSCFIQQDLLKNYQLAEQQNISNYAKKIMLFYVRKKQAQSSSIEAFSCFRQGIHFVGQDFQKNKESPYVIHSKFSQVPEEAFGYLLKPDYMRSQNNSPLYTNKNFTRAQLTKIKFNILSGQKIILNELAYRQFHVQAFIKGGISDDHNNKIYKSGKKTEGFYTQIGLECEFVVYNEEMLTIVILVRNSENSKILAGRAVSLKWIREGLRTLQLFNERMQTKENSYLLIHYTKKQILSKDEKANKMQEFLK